MAIDAASITAAVQAYSFAQNKLQGVIDKRAEHLAQEQAQEILDKLANAQDVLSSLRDERAELQEKLDQLRSELKQHQDWERKSAPYQLTETEGHAIVYMSEGPPMHYACPACFDNKKLQLLQDLRNPPTGNFRCPFCEALYPVNAPRSRPPRKAINADGFGEPDWRI